MAKEQCFIIAPISTPTDRIPLYQNDPEHCQIVIDHILVPAAELAGFEAIPPAAKGSVMIQEKIVRHLQEARMVLCDMSCLNANVFFELGIRTALNKPVCLVRDERTPNIPFDLTQVNSREYSSDLRTDIVPITIKKIAEHLKSSAQNTNNELWKHFGLRIAAETFQKNAPQTETSLLLMEITALRRMMGKRGSVVSAEWTEEDDRKFRANILRCMHACGDDSGVKVQGIFWDNSDVLDVLVDSVSPPAALAYFHKSAQEVLRELGGFGNEPKIRIRPPLTVD